MIKALPLLLLAAACAPVENAGLPAARDRDGHFILPPQCGPAELAKVDVPVRYIPRSTPILHGPEGPRDGVWVRVAGVSYIFIRDDLIGWAKAGAEAHEKCHQVRFETTGSPVFHR